MKSAINSSRQHLCGAASILALALLSLASQARADVALTDGLSTALVDVNSAAGMHHWDVNGQNQLNQQWFWYRTDSGLAHPINNLSSATVNQTAANAMTSTYNNGVFGVTISYLLKYNGVGSADITEGISVQNNSLNAAVFHLYQYSNFDLLGNPNGDTINVDYSSASQSKGINNLAEGIIAPDANYYEANLTGGPGSGSTLDRLATVAGLNLNNNGTATGDVTWAFQWDLTIPAGTTVDVYKDKLLDISVVPEPSSLALIGLGLAALSLRRRRSA